MKTSYTKWAAVTLLTGTIAFGAASAYAGAMPYEQPSVLDRALLDIQGQNQPTNQPVVEETVVEETVVEETTVIQEEPALEIPEFTDEPIAVVEPAPADRVVGVQDNQSFFGLSIGAYDPFTHDDLAAALGVEYQPGVRIAGFLQPIFGAFATHEGSFMGYGGLGAPIQLGSSNWMLMPSAAVGYYEEGDGYDLGQHVAYRIGTELAYVFENKSRLGLNAHVITNAKSFDSDDRTEVISLVYTMPIGFDGLWD